MKKLGFALLVGIVFYKFSLGAPQHSPASDTELWKTIENLTSVQKLQEALTVLEKAMSASNGKKLPDNWVKYLAKGYELEIGLRGFENALVKLKSRPWPLAGDFNASLTQVQILFAHGLTTYAQNYSWEIRKRERMERDGTASAQEFKISLKQWTYEEIYREAYRSYLEAWKYRSSLKSISKTGFLESVQPNTYPDAVRDTARDVLSYLFSNLLTDSGGWSPRESSSVYQLDIDSLLEPIKPTLQSNTELKPQSLHPLQILSEVLLDLEAWNLTEKKPEAAFEARLQLYRQLKTHFTLPSDQEKIRNHLNTDLNALSQENAWIPMGLALLAEMTQTTDKPDRQIQAHEIATRCVRHDFKGPQEKTELIKHGKASCRDLLKNIELPNYQLQGMFVDGSKRRTLSIDYKNLTQIYFRSYRVDIINHIETNKDYNLWLDYRDFKSFLNTRKIHSSWKTPLEPTPDFMLHKKSVVPPAHDPGFYVIVASAKEDFSEKENIILGTQMFFSDYVLNYRQKSTQGEIEAQVLRGEEGEVVPGAQVRLYHFDYNKGTTLETSGTTGRLGEVILQSRTPSYYNLVAKIGNQWVMPLQNFHTSHYKVNAQIRSSLIYTDRSIYRPNQKISWKVVAYEGNTLDGKYQASPSQSISLTLNDANGEGVETKTVQTNAFGTASGEFLIPSGRLLGQWQIISSLAGSSVVRVEEYKRPTFEVQLEDSKSGLQLNQAAKFSAAAKYYFGQPVKSGFSKWKITRTAHYPWWCLWGGWSWLYSQFGPKEEIVSVGGGSLPADGSIKIEFTPKADQRKMNLVELIYDYRIELDVTDEGGETRSATRLYRIGFQSIQAQITFPSGFMGPNQSFDVTVLRTDLNLSPARGAGNWKILRLKQPSDVKMPADQALSPELQKLLNSPYSHIDDLKMNRWQVSYDPKLYMRAWEAEGTSPGFGKDASGLLQHDAKGEGVIHAPPLPPGVYRLIYESKDDFGSPYQTQAEFLVADSTFKAQLPAFLRLEKNSLQVGETVKILAFTSRPKQSAILEIFRRGQRADRKTIEASETSESRVFGSGSQRSVFEYPITEADRGGLGITLTLVGDYQSITLHETLHVPWSNKEIGLEFGTFRDYLQAGGQGGKGNQPKEKWSIKVKANDPFLLEKANLELLTYMYDKSLDALSPHQPANPIRLYPIRSNVSTWILGLGTAPSAYFNASGFSVRPEARFFYSDYVKLGPAYGVGGVGGGRLGNRRNHVARDSFDAPSELSEGLPSSSVAAPAKAKMNLAEKAENRLEAQTGRERSKSDSFDDRDQNQAEGEAQGLRTNFSETAFWIPHLLLDKNSGAAEFEFTIPDSITAWSVWVHGITQDLKSGTVQKTVRTAKDMMVRPYLPRFLREGDQAKIKVVLQNTTHSSKKGRFDLELFDSSTQKKWLNEFGLTSQNTENLPFEIPPQGSVALNFLLKVPKFTGSLALRAYAKSGNLGDGELRPLPVLPGRFHLAQSKFVSLKNKSKKEIHFNDLKTSASDPTLNHDQLVVTLDAQLFYSVLSSLPYLIHFPHECTEQTLNRFLSSAILATLFEKFPAVAKMAATFSKRETLLETFDQPDPNRKLLLEETPWLEVSKGGGIPEKDLIKILDPKVASQQQKDSLKQLEKAQTQSGGFPWFPGGPPSPYFTTYVLYGFSKALEFGVKLPNFSEAMIQKAWGYMHTHYLSEWVKLMMERDCCWENITFLNYVLSHFRKIKTAGQWGFEVFTETEAKKMLDFSFKHWKMHSPYLKGYLALTLKKMDRPEEAKRVWDSVMDSVKYSEEEGAHWTREDRTWLWYHDTIETHAFALRTGMEMGVKRNLLDGLVHWLFLNKKLNHWKSTRATSEVIYSLTHFLKETHQLGQKEDATVRLGSQTHTFEFLPDQYSGKKNQIVIPGEKLNSTFTPINLQKSTTGFLFASATWHYSTEKLPAKAHGDFLSVTRSYFKRVTANNETRLIPLFSNQETSKLGVGDEVEVHLTLRSKHPVEYVHLRDPRAAGFEPTQATSAHRYALGLYWYEEIRDSGTNFFFESLPQGEYPFKYRIRATTSGHFKAFPATVQPMYAPEFTAYSAGDWLDIE